MPSDIARVLNQRGHKVTKEGSERDLLLPQGEGLSPERLDSFKDILYNLMRDGEFRRALRDWAYERPVDYNENLRYIEAYQTLCEKFGGWPSDKEAVRQRYAATFEWYVCELFLREFSARAGGFGICLADADPADEFDCIVLLDDGLVFIECKTGHDDIYRQIKKFIRRDWEIGAVYSLFVYDRDYTFSKDGDDSPDITYSKAEKYEIAAIGKVAVKDQNFFHITGRRQARGGRYLLACSALNGFEDRIRYMIRYTNEDRNTRRASDLFSVTWFPFKENTKESQPVN
jgi:hypothetical protein